MAANAYQHIVVKGSAYERGFSHGQQVKTKIHLNILRYKSSPAMPPWDECLEYVLKSYIPTIKKLFLTGFTEMQGIAAGAGVDMEDIVFLNARYDLARASDRKVGECTSLALHCSNGEAVVAQNWDMAAWLHDLDTIIVLESHLVDPEYPQPQRIIGLTEAGQLMRSGMNSCGLGICANSLWSNGDTTPTNKSCMPFTLARAMYLQCTNFAAGLKTLCTFPRHVSGNLMAASRELAIDLELSPTQKFLLHAQPLQCDSMADHDRLLTHANHFEHPAMASASLERVQDNYVGGSSLFRAMRLNTLVRASAVRQCGVQSEEDLDRSKKRHHNAAFPPSPTEDESSSDKERCDSQPRSHPRILIKTLQAAFSDHASFPRSLCEHKTTVPERYGASSYGEETMTVACVIYDLARGEMHVSNGNPCRNLWSIYVLEME